MATSQGLKGRLLDCPKSPTKPHEDMKLKPKTGPFRTNDSQFPLSVGSSMLQVAAKGQPPEGTQAKPAGCRHGGSWNAGFDPATKEPKTCKRVQKRLKRQRKCKRMHKAQNCKKSRPRTVLTCRRLNWVHALAHSSQPSIEFTADCYVIWQLTFSTPDSAQHVRRTLTKRRL